MERKGFTLVELLVVIAIIALLMGILMPALSRVRAIAFRLICGTNLSGIGKAMLVYANDYDDEFPRAGYGANPELAAVLPDWSAGTRAAAFGTANKATITSSFYLLVKFAEVTPKSFVCKSDSGAKEFKLSYFSVTGKELVDVWDFGNTPSEYCSYAYHHPYNVYALTTSSDPGMAVAADRNPWMKPPGAEAKTDSDWATYCDGISKNDSTKIRIGNAVAHQEDGQNVLFVDSHVDFEKRPYCGVDDDNIYTRLGNTSEDRRLGNRPPRETGSVGCPLDRLDSYLLNNVKIVIR